MNKNNLKRFLVLFSFGVAYGFMYVMPYMKSSFYDQMIAAMQCTNAQLGSLMTYYTIALTISYLPGGWIADKFKPKTVLLASTFGQAVLSFVFMVTYRSYTMAVIIWILMSLTGGFAFWPALMKGIRMLASDEEQGRIFGIFEGLNGFASLILSFIMIGILALAGKADPVMGFKGAVASMGVLAAIAGFLILFLFDGSATYGNPSDQTVQSSGSFGMKDFLSTFKIPGVWFMSALVWCFVTTLAVSSYLTPYSTSVLGLSPVLAASIGTLRTYGCRLIGGPLGGFIADKVVHSVSKEQAIGQFLCLISLGLFLIVPAGTNGMILVIMLLFVGIAMFACKGTNFSIQPEVGIATNVSATAVAIATLIGYLPDIFVHTMFGNWIDTYGNDGYTRILIYGIVTAAIGILIAIAAAIQSKKIANAGKTKTA